MLSLALVSVGLFIEAIRRLLLYSPSQTTNVDGPLMSGIAAIGVIVNVILALVLGEHHVHMPGADHHCHEEEVRLIADGGEVETTTCVALPQHADELPPPSPSPLIELVKKKVTTTTRNINLHAAYLHVLSDLAQSMAVLIAGLVIWWKPSWQVVDPICTLGFCALVFYSTLGVLRSSISVLLEEVPPNLSWRNVHEDIERVYGVTNVHDLHIWSISHGVPTLSVHCTSTNPQQALEDIYKVCQKYSIVHATVQVQGGLDGDCITCTGNVKVCHFSSSRFE
jgi:zinc transporter 2